MLFQIGAHSLPQKKKIKPASPEKHGDVKKRKKKRKPNKRNKYRNNSGSFISSDLSNKPNCSSLVNVQEHLTVSSLDGRNILYAKKETEKIKSESRVKQAGNEKKCSSASSKEMHTNNISSTDAKDSDAITENPMEGNKRKKQKKMKLQLSDSKLHAFKKHNDSANSKSVNSIDCGNDEGRGSLEQFTSKKRKNDWNALEGDGTRQEKCAMTDPIKKTKGDRLIFHYQSNSDETEEQQHKKKRKRRKKKSESSNLENTEKHDLQNEPDISFQISECDVSLLFGKKKKSEISNVEDEVNSSTDLRHKMLAQLAGGQFRYINEQLYSVTGHEAHAMFKEDAESFKLYHEGYRNQVLKWPINPVDVIIAEVQKM